MEISLLLKVAGVGVLVAVAYQILNRTGRDEQAMLVSLAGVVIVLILIVNELDGLFSTIRGIFGI